MRPRSAIARTLIGAGRRTSGRAVVLLDSAVGYVALGRWLQLRRFAIPEYFTTREELFACAAAARNGGAFLYLEFGVHEGASIGWWVNHVSDATARFIGFDSFLGLPEPWNEQNRRGHFSTAGVTPSINDNRLEFVVGWFDETLPAWHPPPYDELFVNLDADLYSSTASVLRALRPYLRPGVWLYFDELNDHEHELRALQEFLDDPETSIAIEPFATAGNLRHWLFRCV